MSLSGVTEDYDDDIQAGVDSRWLQIAMGHATGVASTSTYALGMTCGHTTKALIGGSWA
ncbi:hypothetical protein NKI12_08075 [Mesorhizobium australicum]|uniref:Uncharacterized protein n=2 Tax=Mesorhizobium australicum TaxID=536018 RepID=A0ACC6STZ4_9HYPH